MIQTAALLNSGNYNVQPPFLNADVESLESESPQEAENACARLARAKPAQNQYWYTPHSFGRATGAAAVIWTKQDAPDPVTPPGFLAARNFQPVDRGHLIPKAYGGSPDYENVITQESKFNQSLSKRATGNAIKSRLTGGEPFVCVLCRPKYNGVGKTGVRDPGLPVPFAFNYWLITGSSWDGIGYMQPQLYGDLRYDPSPWNTWANGVSSLNY